MNPDWAVIFDLDGLMLDTESIGITAWERAGADLGISVSKEVQLEMMGLTLRDIPTLLHERLGPGAPVEDLMERANLHYHQLLEAAPPGHKEGLTGLLDFIDDHGIAKAVGTSSTIRDAAKKLASAGLAQRFSVVVSGDEVPYGKPAPDLFIEVAARLGKSPGNCFVLEDSIHGIVAAHRAGMRPVMIPDHITPSDDVAALTEAVFPSLREVTDWFRSMSP